jgi:isopenicillin N synthase-like dioxygenase
VTGRADGVPELVPRIDLNAWFDGDGDDRAAVARQVDQALRTSGFLLIVGHRIPAALRAQSRAVARQFFALPAEVKTRYTVAAGSRPAPKPTVSPRGRPHRRT